eukprot:TRINITY_DN1503_c0_g4_i1.p1 TRINITY_DN1503_c0_g4~~TRINITY_DN1503_c0_g4_i1.p1  ORF type:complete len:352 (-),score=44.71 TRINITY_DN1503_c0_g4_i1:45-1100(-)
MISLRNENCNPCIALYNEPHGAIACKRYGGQRTCNPHHPEWPDVNCGLVQVRRSELPRPGAGFAALLPEREHTGPLRAHHAQQRMANTPGDSAVCCVLCAVCCVLCAHSPGGCAPVEPRAAALHCSTRTSPHRTCIDTCMSLTLSSQVHGCLVLSCVQLSFRGTDAATVTDILEDLDNHLEAVIFEGMSVVVPVMQFYPSKVVWTVIDYTRRLQVALGLASTETYHDTAARQVEAVMVSKGPRVIVTGHSLGGLVAQVVAAHLGVTGVGISAPGMLLAHAKFGLQPSAVGAHTVNVVPDRDLIPTIDSQMSSVIRVPCSAKTFVDCHDPLSTICELHRACGSHKFKACHQL